MKEEINLKKTNKKKYIYVSVCIILVILSMIFGIKMGNILISMILLLGIIVILFSLKNTKRLVYVQIIYIVALRFLTSNLNIANIANYALDLNNLIIFIIALYKYIKMKKEVNIKVFSRVVFFRVVFLMFICSLIGLIINGQSILLYLWSLRNIYRFFMFTFSCAVLLDKKDIDKIFKILFIMLIINVFICSFQYFILKVSQDGIGGTFGVNHDQGYMNIFLIIILTYALVEYLNKNKKLYYLIFVLFASCYIATIGELKFFYIEALIIVVLSILFIRLSKKTVILLIVSFSSILLAINILYTLYPGFKNYFNLETIIEGSSKSGYSQKGQINRLSGIGIIDEMFLSNATKKAFGIGSGSAEVSQFEPFNSQFAQTYNDTLKYSWFSNAFMVLENGYIGLFLYIGTFLALFYENARNKKYNKEEGDIYTIVQILSIMSISLIWYNSSLRTEAAYMIYLVLSMGYIVNKDNALKLKEQNKI